MRTLIKQAIKDSPFEPYVRWCVKRIRGIKMPYDLVVNEIYDRQASEVISCVMDTSSNAIDVGCHKGRFMVDFLKYSPNGHHFAFEPIPEMAEALANAFPMVDVRNCALSDKPGNATFFVIPKAPALSGLNERRFLSPALERKAISVVGARLDDVIPSDVNIRMIKIDVEGAEGLVMAGAKKTIARHRPYIIFEHGRSSSEAFDVSPESIYTMLKSCGLEVSTLKDWLCGAPSLTVDRFVTDEGWYYLAHPEPRKHA